MFFAEGFLSKLVSIHKKHSVSTDDRGTWYPQACKFLNLNYHIHFPFEKNLIERSIQYIKDRIESFDIIFLVIKRRNVIIHVKNWLNLFVNMYNKRGKRLLTEPYSKQHLLLCYMSLKLFLTIKFMSMLNDNLINTLYLTILIQIQVYSLKINFPSMPPNLKLEFLYTNFSCSV